MQRLLAIYRTFNLLSLDVVAGAVIGAMFFAKRVGVTTSFSSLVALFCTVWIIYTTDHLLDVRSLKVAAATERHRFHQKYFTALSSFVVLFLMVDLTSIFYMPQETVHYGMVLGGFVGVYVVLHKKLSIGKEFSVAVLYVLGIIAPAISMASISSVDLLLLVIYFLIAFINLVLFAFIERASDMQDGHPSIAIALGEKKTARLLKGSFAVVAMLNLILFVLTRDFKLVLIMISMAALLYVIYQRSRTFNYNDWYRLLGDAVFLLPVLYLL